MHLHKSPFPAYWLGTELEGAGLESVRPNVVGTYGRYEYDRLPPLPFEQLHGNFDWLSSAPPRRSNIGLEKAIENAQALVALRQRSMALGLRLPAEFVKFMESPSLQERIRSNTDCFLDLCASPVRSPVGGGYLIRFLSDSQGCIFWYLYLTEGGQDHAVVASPGFYGIDDEQWLDGERDPTDIVFSAESFEIFLCRFWLENEIWFASWKNTPMPEAGRVYIEQYRQNRD